MDTDEESWVMKQSRRMAFGHYDYAVFLGFLTYASGSVVVPVSLVILACELNFRLENGGMTAAGIPSLLIREEYNNIWSLLRFN